MIHTETREWWLNILPGAYRLMEVETPDSRAINMSEGEMGNSGMKEDR